MAKCEYCGKEMKFGIKHLMKHAKKKNAWKHGLNNYFTKL